MTADAHDVAAYLVLRHRITSTLRLHTLLYFVQVAALRDVGTALFRQPVEAWEPGPVVPDLVLMYGLRDALYPGLCDASAVWRLSVPDRRVVDAQVKRFAHLDDAHLVALACVDEPYLRVRERMTRLRSLTGRDASPSGLPDFLPDLRSLTVTAADLDD